MNATWQDLAGSALGHVQGMGGAAPAALRAVLLAMAAWLTILAAQRAGRSLRMHIACSLGAKESVQRAETLGRVFRDLAAVAISLLAGTLILGELGVSVAPIFAAAAVAGLAIGFGAQSLVQDHVTGFFLLVDPTGACGAPG